MRLASVSSDVSSVSRDVDGRTYYRVNSRGDLRGGVRLDDRDDVPADDRFGECNVVNAPVRNGRDPRVDSPDGTSANDPAGDRGDELFDKRDDSLDNRTRAAATVDKRGSDFFAPPREVFAPMANLC